QRLTQAEQGQILMLDAETDTLEIIASSGPLIRRTVPLHDSVCGAAVRQAGPVRIANWKTDARYRDIFKDLLAGTISELAVPSAAEEITLVLNVESPREGAFSARDERLLSAFARQTLIGFRHFLRTRENLLDAEKMTRVATDLASVARIEDAIYQRALHAATELTGCPFGQILIQLAEKLLVKATTEGDPGPPLDINRCGSGVIIREQIPIRCSNDLTNDSIPNFRQWRSGTTKSVLMAGFKTAQRYDGVLNLESSRRDHFTERHQRLVCQLMEHVSVAVHMNRSYRGLSQVSHDLVNKGATLGVTAHVIDKAFPNAPAEVKEAVETIMETARVISQMSADILPRVPSPEVLLLREVVSEAISLAEVKNVAHIEGSFILPPVVFDYLHLRRVLQHLLSNCKYAVAACESPAIRIEGFVDAGGETVRVRVSDNGVGIKPEQAERAFEPGYSDRPDGTRSSGMGLSFCQEIMMKSQGAIQFITPGFGVGTTIEVSFRAAVASLLIKEGCTSDKVVLITDDCEWASDARKVLKDAGICAEHLSRTDHLADVAGAVVPPEAPVVFVDLRGPLEDTLKAVELVLPERRSKSVRRHRLEGGLPLGRTDHLQFSAMVGIPTSADFICDLFGQAVGRANPRSKEYARNI
ncbi:MAG: GAF domain-containing sensor histidine kinase, partial [Bryobacteraceae bacterium]